MKLTRITADAAITPDYEMLRAALVAAQSATPTARTAAQIHDRAEDIAALHALLTEARTASADAAALGHSFARRAPQTGDQDT